MARPHRDTELWIYLLAGTGSGMPGEEWYTVLLCAIFLEWEVKHD